MMQPKYLTSILLGGICLLLAACVVQTIPPAAPSAAPAGAVGEPAEATAEPTAAAAESAAPVDSAIGSAVDPPEVGDPERGREIFETGGGVISVENSCSQCHSLDGTVQTSLAAGPSIQDISKQAGDRAPELPAVEYLRQSIVDPSAYVAAGFADNKMPKAYGFWLNEEDVDNLVAFMLTQ